jgi:K+-sensing histidine kinase KdpD
MIESQLRKQPAEHKGQDDPFDANHLMNGLLVTGLVSLGLVFTPTFVAVPVLVALAFACGRIGGRDAGNASVAVGSLMYGYAITEPHFRWAIDNDHDVVLLVVLFAASMATAELGARLRLRKPSRA